jgi:leader peptidase (prepilin peptidase)/N-methyltransferase
MLFILALSFFVFGTIIGSFLNVVILRYNTGKSINGRSGCANCRKPLEPHELVPILSFALLRGRCSGCKSKISWQYPLVEFFTGLLLILIFLKLFLPQGSLLNPFFAHPFLYVLAVGYLVIQASLLVVIFVYDLKHKIIPNGPVYAFAILSLVNLTVADGTHLLHFPYLLNLLAGPIFFLGFYLIWLVSRGRAMGFGDAKLVLGIGWFLGFVEGISALILGFWIGAVISICLILTQYVSKNWLRKSGSKKSIMAKDKSELSMKSEIPFAPFLILGIIIAYAFNVDILSLHLLLGL